jgi:DNA-binding transcriptional LysR family regulator
MNFRQIEAFRAVITCRTVTRAAETLRISQPAVSRLLDQLEHSTKLRLFDRGKGRIRATPEGLAFFREVEKVHSGLERLRFAAENIRSFSGGTVRIASLPVMGHAFLPRVIGHFSRSCPNATVLLQIRSSEAVKELVSSGQVDIGFAADEIDPAGVISESFAEPEAVCLLPAEHRLADKPEIRPTDLIGERFVSLALEDATRARIDAAFDMAGVSRQLVVETQYSLTVCNLVRHNLGVSLVNPFALENLDMRDLVLKPFRPAITFQTLMLLPAHGLASRQVTLFQEAATSELSIGPAKGQLP